MATQTHCPRCKQPLSVADKKPGSQLDCPRCRGRFSVAKPAPSKPSPSGPSAGNSVALSGADNALGAGPGSLSSPSARKVARLISPEAAQSSLKLAADGQLPHLQLLEGARPDKAEAKSSKLHPLVLAVGLGLSAVLSVALVLTGGESSPSATSQQKATALKVIEENYFGNPERGELAPYQVYLRGAIQARCRGDRKAECQNYRRVLDVLRTEPRGGTPPAGRGSGGSEPGITGSRQRDRTLENQITVLLGE